MRPTETGTSRRLSWLLALGVIALGGAAWGGSMGVLEAVSPGSATEAVVVAGACPTFSWGATGSLHAVELAVHEVDERDPTGILGLAVQAELPGGALSWTPSEERCLEPGRTYAWSVRGIGDEGATPWSESRFLRVSSRPSLDEVEWAYDILKRHLAEEPAPTTPALTGPATPSTSVQGMAVPGAAEPTVAAAFPAPNAIGDEDAGLAVDGLIEAKGIRAVANPPDEAGNILADGDISAPFAILKSPGVVVTDGTGQTDLVELSADGVGSAVLSTPGTQDGEGDLLVDRLVVERIDAGGISVPGSSSWTGTGGSGFFEVNSATHVNVDNNPSTCPSGGVVVAVRLWETDNDQIGVQVQCSVVN